ncbi:hypothetical protein LNO81_11955 [Klebsiella variicola subsp. variicola]|nr:hypothetical protein [Klebsiella variicola subsp. variicola]
MSLKKSVCILNPIGLRDLYSVNKLRFSDGALISIYDDWQNEIAGLVKEELIRKKIPYANEYGPDFRILDYIRTLTPPKTRHESNLMVDKLSEIEWKLKIKSMVVELNSLKFQHKVLILNIHVIEMLGLKPSRIRLSQVEKRKW